MTSVQALQLQLLLLLLLLPLPLLRSSPCPSAVEEMVVKNTSDAKTLAEALLCDGPANFTVSWHGDVTLSHTLSVSNGSTLNVAGSSENTDADKGAVVTSDGALLLFKVDHRSTVSLTGLTLYGGDGALRVSGDSLVEAGDCTFKNNNRTSSNHGGAIFVAGSSVVLKGETVFANNTADYGGAIYLTESSEFNITEGGRVYFVNNHAAVYGGAVRLYNQSVFNSYGTASFTSNEAENGGGAIGANTESKVFFRGETVFAYNTAATEGGAIQLDDSEGNFIGNVSFEGNHALTNGGAIDGGADSNAFFRGEAVFAYNTAIYGGAINFFGSKLNFIGNVLFEDNHANASGGAVYADEYTSVFIGSEAIFASNTAAYGGAIYSDDNSEVNITEGASVSFFNNYADNSAGAVLLDNQTIFNSYGAASLVSNEALIGGAIYAKAESNVFFRGETVFAYNTATTEGGAIHLDDSEGNFIGNVSFEGNHANTNGGAIYASSSSVFVGNGTTLFVSNAVSTGSGGGVYASSSVIALTGAEFTENHGVWGGGVALFSSGFISDEDISDEEDGVFAPSYITACRFDGNTATDGGAIYTAAGYDVVGGSSFTRNSAVVQGGALLHSGVLQALTNCTFESNIAGEEGLAVMSLGIANKIADITFRNNSFSCSSGKYGWEKDSDEVEDNDTCRWDVVCSRCTDPQCDVPTTGIDMDSTTVPVCEEVPEGVNTIGYYSGMTLETLDLMSGFYRTSSQSSEILECYREEACVGGSTAGRYCAEGYAGPYCATCDEGYGSGFQYSCHSCQGSDKWAAIGGAIAVFSGVIFAVALGVGYLVGVVDRPISERSGRWERRISSFRDGLKRAIPLTAIKILLVSWQIITQFSGVVNVQYPPAYENLLASLSIVNLNLGFILSLSCVVETNFYARLVLVTIAPVAVLGTLTITYRIAMLRNGHSIHAKRMARNKHLAVGLFLLFMVYSSVSYTIFQTFVCDLLDSGVTYLRADYDLECWTKTHVACMTYAGIMILVYPVGIPAVFAWVLYKYRKSIKRVAETTNRTQVPSEAETIKDLWAPYKRSRYYYEVIECGRRIALTGLAVFIYPGSTAQVAIEALLAIVFYSISEILSPFAEPLDAWLYRSGTCVIFLSMYLALLLKMDVTDEDSHSQNVFAGLLIAAHVGMILVAIANALMSAMKGFREVRAIEIPSRKSGFASTRENDIEILEGDEDDISKYIPNPLFGERRQTNFAPL